MLKPSSVLVVDDDAVLREVALRVLRNAADQLLEAATGREALDLVRRYRPAVILLDVVLPDIDGVEVCRRIKADPELAGTFVLMISGLRTGSETQAEALEAGANGYVTRPISNRELLARVENALQLQRTLEELRETQEYLRRIIETSPVPISLIDLEGRVQLWNQAAARLFGWAADEVVGRPMPIVQAENQEEFDRLRARVARGETLQNIALRRRTKGDKPVDLSLSASPVHDAGGEIVGIMAALLDVSELNSLTEALRHERDLLSGIMEVNPAGVTVVDATGDLVFANPAAERVLGLNRTEITSRRYDDPAWRITAYNGTPMPVEDLPFSRVMATRRPVHDVHHAIEWPDGTRKLLSISGAPLFGVEGQIERVVLTVTDDTAHIRQDEHVLQLNDVLRAIRDVNQLLVREKDPDRLIAECCRILVASQVYDNAWITTVGSDGAPQRTAYAGEGLRDEVLTHAPSADALLRCVETTFAAPKTCVGAECSQTGEDCPLRKAAGDSVPMAAALRHQMAQYGVLSVGVNPAFAADPESMDLLEEIAGDIALALHNIETEAAFADQVQSQRAFELRLETLVAVTNELALTRSVDALCRRAVELAVERLGFERIGIWLSDEQDPTRQRGTFGIDEEGNLRDERGKTVPVDAWLQDWIDRAKPEVEYAQAIELYDERRAQVGTGTLARAMLWHGDAFAGTVSIDNLLSGAPITEHDRHVLRLFAATLSNLLVRTKTEVVLQEREQFYRTVFETTGSAMMVLEDDMTLLTVNEEAERLLGYSRQALENGLTFDAFVVDEDRDLVVSRHHQRRREPARVPSQYEFRIRDRAGTIKDVAVTVGLIPGTRRSVVSVLDVTAQKVAVAAMQRHAALQSAIGQIAMHTVEAPDLETLTQKVLEETLTMMGLDHGSCWCGDLQTHHGMDPGVIRAFIAQLPAPEEGAMLTFVDDDLRASGPSAQPTSILQTQGLDAVAVVVNQRSGAPEEVTGILVAGPAPRSWNEEELRLLEAVGWQLSGAAARLGLLAQAARQARRLQHVIDTVPEGVLLLAADSRVLLANPLARSELDFLSGAGVGDQITQLGDRPVDEILSPPPSGSWHEIAYGGRNFEVVAEPLSELHDLDGWVLVLRDVTDERTMARQLAQQERLASVGHLAAGIAHDFNNILAVIILYAEMASRRLSQVPEVQRHLKVVQEQAHRASDLIQQILDFSRRAALERRPMDLVPFLKEQIKLLERTLPESIAIELVHDGGRLRIDADPTRIQQVLMNLATNARDAMPQGGAIRISLHELTFDDDAAAPLPGMLPGPWVRLTFSDTGEGMSPEALDNAFEPFFTTKATGTGLGLAQIYGIVKQHGGEVDIASRAGEGTAVSLYFPALVEKDDGAAAEAFSDVLSAGAGQRILVVEDNAQTRAALVAALTSLDYVIVEAGHGGEALEVLAEQGDDIDLIISDAIMPVMGIGRLLEALVERGYTQPVIVVSGYLEPEEKAQLHEGGQLFAWLTKPVRLQELAAVTALALNAR